MAEIVITEFMDEAAISSVLAGRDVMYDPKLVDQPDNLARLVKDARALIVRNRTQVRGALLEAAEKLEVVGRLGVGLDNIDVEACKTRGIAVYPATGANDVSVAEYVITAMLVLLRRAWFASDEVASGKWPRMSTIGREVQGKTLGLIGLGGIARETASRARALGMNVLAFDPLLPKDHAAWRSDVISLHVPLIASTKRMIGPSQIAAMKRGSVIINAARGGVIDEAAVVDALRSGQLGGAALDVFETEPLDVAAGTLFADVPNLILTPHIAGVTEESNVRVSEVTARTVLAHLTRSGGR
jgi:(S)-sulfolactate dehydrogenase